MGSGWQHWWCVGEASWLTANIIMIRFLVAAPDRTCSGPCTCLLFSDWIGSWLRMRPTALVVAYIESLLNH